MLPELKKWIRVMTVVLICMILILSILIIYTWYHLNGWEVVVIILFVFFIVYSLLTLLGFKSILSAVQREFIDIKVRLSKNQKDK
jgi:uncharacterized protein (DUF983 family)